MILPTTTAREEGKQLSSSDERREEENLSAFAVPRTSNFIPNFADSSTGGGGSSYQVAASGRNSDRWRKEEMSVEASKSKIKTK